MSNDEIGNCTSFCRILLDPQPNPGSWNMAVDETLLETAVEERAATVRWYRWSEPTVSLGYFQDSASVLAAPRFAPLATVRRLSGGGAILHHLELTYSLTLPPGHPLVRDHERLYERVHEAIIDVLARHGVPARLRGQTRQRRDEPFLCFSRGDARDVVIDGHKVVGSAQRRRRGAIVQHGSVLLRRSPHAPEFPGILDLVEDATVSVEAAAALADAVGSLAGEPAIEPSLSPCERRRAAELERTRYRALDWKHR